MTETTDPIAKRDALITQWLDMAKSLEKTKAEEMILRKAVVAIGFPAHKVSGTENLDLGNGYKLKAVFSQNYKLDNKDDAVDKALVKIEKTGTEGKFIAERLIRWKPELSKTEYDLLNDKHKAIIDEVITTSDGSPSLEFIIPKTK